MGDGDFCGFEGVALGVVFLCGDDEVDGLG